MLRSDYYRLLDLWLEGTDQSGPSAEPACIVGTNSDADLVSPSLLVLPRPMVLPHAVRLYRHRCTACPCAGCAFA